MPRKALVGLTETMFYVLMAFCRESMCGIDVASFIDNKTDGRVQIGPATLYTILGKFEKEKYIVETEVSGRKRTYSVTQKGKEAYQTEVNRLRLCITDAESENYIRGE